jgi:excisionase family DNA binding protein
VIVKPLLVTVQQACDLLGIKKSKLYTLAAAREITVCRIGRTQITLESIERLIERSIAESSQ